jgi:hypothetical protein
MPPAELGSERKSSVVGGGNFLALYALAEVSAKKHLSKETLASLQFNLSGLGNGFSDTLHDPCAKKVQ